MSRSRPAALALALAAALAVPETGMAAPSGENPTRESTTMENSTTTWPADELQRIVAADDLHVSPFREDGKTYGTPTWIWCVAVDGALYVRAYSGPSSRWYQAAMREKAGRITAAGATREVRFEPADPALADRIDAAYRAKYPDSRYLAPMIGAGPRAATVRIVPRGAGS